MFSKILSAFLVLVMSAMVALAAPSRAFEGYIKKVAKESGKSEEEVREKAKEVLEGKEGVSKDELDRIGKKDAKFEEARARELINLLKADPDFRSKYLKLAESKVAKKSGEEFKAYAEGKLKEGDTKIAAVENFIDAFGLDKQTAENLRSLEPATRDHLVKIGNILLKRAKSGKGGFTMETARGMVQAGEGSVKIFRGVSKSGTAFGENISEACLEMRADALGNLVTFVRYANENTDSGLKPTDRVKEYTEKLSKSAAEKFKQDYEDGKARICALAGAECNIFTQAISKSCGKAGKTAAR